MRMQRGLSLVVVVVMVVMVIQDGYCYYGEPHCGPGNVYWCEGPSRQNCNRPCGKRWAPVCGSNGQTYRNFCVFKNANCGNPALQLVRKGLCSSSISYSSGNGIMCQCCRRLCSPTLSAVCASDGRTYDNHCDFVMAQCDSPGLSIKHQGPCLRNDFHCGPGSVYWCEGPKRQKRQKCYRSCNRMLAPVCASNHKTYGNYCTFENAKCGIPGLQILHYGRCFTIG